MESQTGMTCLGESTYGAFSCPSLDVSQQTDRNEKDGSVHKGEQLKLKATPIPSKPAVARVPYPGYQL